jgi:hypothetical protein
VQQVDQHMTQDTTREMNTTSCIFVAGRNLQLTLQRCMSTLTIDHHYHHHHYYHHHHSLVFQGAALPGLCLIIRPPGLSIPLDESSPLTLCIFLSVFLPVLLTLPVPDRCQRDHGVRRGEDRRGGPGKPAIRLSRQRCRRAGSPGRVESITGG